MLSGLYARLCYGFLAFTVQCYASSKSLVVCPSVHLSNAGTVTKWLNSGSHKQYQGLRFSAAKISQ